jgi:hypothetical protein
MTTTNTTIPATSLTNPTLGSVSVNTPGLSSAGIATPGARTVNGGGQGVIDGITDAQYQVIDGVVRTVQENETVQGQLKGILEEGSPLMTQARTKALEQMQSRGLLNSSLAVQSGQAAVIDRALQIATPDAATYAQASRDNQSIVNDTNRFNAGNFNSNSQFNAQSRNALNQQRVADAAALNRVQVQEAGAMQRLQVSEAGAMQRLQVSESGANTRAQLQASTQRSIAEMNNQTSMAVAGMQAETARSTNAASIAANYALSEMNRQYAQELNSSNNAATLYRDGVSQIGSILTNPDLDDARRQSLIDNQVQMINTGLNLVGSATRITNTWSAPAAPAPAPATYSGSGPNQAFLSYLESRRSTQVS